MRSERKANIIRALKDEIDFYKRQHVCVKYSIDMTRLNHLRLSSAYSADEILNIPKSILVRRMVKPFEDVIMELPIETEYDENVGVYRASLDIWVKPMGRK